MFKSQCLVTFIILTFRYVRTWDIAITAGDQLEFYTNTNKTSNEGDRFRDLTALAYDAVHNMLLFVDRQNDNASIFSYDIEAKKYNRLVGRRSDENIQGLAFDPVKRILFWTDSNERSIFWMSLKNESSIKEPNEKIYGKVLFKINEQMPRAIAVDSCRGYIYWTNTNVSKATIERFKFDDIENVGASGVDKSKIEVVVDTNIFMPVSIAIDQHEKKLYWADDKEGINYSIESSDLDGKNRKTLLRGIHHQPNSLSVSKDYIYWVDWGYRNVWKLLKNTTGNTDPEELISFNSKATFGIVANYPIADQTEGVQECKALVDVSQNKTEINDSFQEDVGLFCVHGVKVTGELPACKCSAGYVGKRCEISLCHNFCLNGDCLLADNGQPKCSCKSGFIGERCEVNVCKDYCLHSGVCTINKEQKPTCKCPAEYEGQKCETLKILPGIVLPSESTCNCTKADNTTDPQVLTESVSDEFVLQNCDGWDSVTYALITVLGTLCGLLCVLCAYLVTKIMQLKKRPRIKKRIIVNKNVTPLTARPDQCEITIENCCNMNICETPCFEPRATIRPTLLDTKPGKEEKKNLIANMELPDDY